MDTRSMDGKEGADGRKEVADGRRDGNEYDHFGGTFKDAATAFDVLRRLSGRGVAEDAIDHSLNWLILSAWSNLDRMKELQDDIMDRLQQIKKSAGILN
ncbi:MAG: hypothetical protein HQK95_09420 [Nitrospirae bacterium]|nr:hypothetical protein [Nitrospirota bacterium]